MIVVFLLAVIVLLLSTRQTGRDYSLGIALLIGAFTWLAIEIHLLRVLADLFAIALEHWTQIVMALSITILLIVPAIMIYLAIRDELDNRAIREEFQQSNGALRYKFNQKVAALIAQGYGRERAEATVARLVDRRLERQTARHNYPR